MSNKVFVDTNIFIYLYSEDEPEKQRISQKLFEQYDCIISTQVLNEFSSVCIGKLNKTAEEVEVAINEIAGQSTLLTIERKHIIQALKVNKKYGYKYFDCLMIVSALDSDSKYFITEDMADGQVINNQLTIVNIYKQKNIEKYLL